MRIDQIMIGHILGETDLGKFSAAVRLSEAWYFIPLAFVTSFAPKLFELKGKNEILYKSSIQTLMRLIVLISVLVALFMTFASEWLIMNSYGAAYKDAGAVLRIHIWGGVFAFLGVISEQWLIANGLQRLAFYRTIFGVIINIIANFFLIPKMGISGAAYATVITQFFVAYLFDLFNSKLRELFFMKSKALFLGDPF
jgi:O-antigen/teichoic acid export membrane protein